jgi:hypothetical protein
MSSSVQGVKPPLSRLAFALPDFSPIVGSSSSSRWPSSIIQRIMPRSADNRLPACDGVRAFISALMTLRVSTANGFSPFSGSRLSISPLRCSRVESDSPSWPTERLPSQWSLCL